ncbi:hydroxyacylglutathione hydrolase [Pandoraea terrae]|uniref:Hydroxyacylglutathione hydrolase n=1 Tax=Pandoraea terrae TaxID=1537710 RepID=A0A5E4ZF92_9BURK|nr:hydroxyacylglutathione hydrolase [Pandoraea terrae]VVE59337.1 hydroxyacylglutathione hydrolase [Pandoraea terrae]
MDAGNDSVKVVPVTAFQDNYIWVLDDGRHAVVVDPGESGPVLDYLAKKSLALTAILLTHHHGDHIGGVAELLAHAPVPVYGPAGESIVWIDHPLAGGEHARLTTPALDFAVLDVPGHTAGHIAYWLAGGPADAPRLFCGDTLFSCGCGRLFEGTAAQMLASLDRISALPGDTHVHCAHEYTLSNIRFALACEPENSALQSWRDHAQRLRDEGRPTLPTTLAQELATNPFLRSDAPGVIAAALRHAGKPHLSREQVFATVRAWKDGFR